MQSRGVVLTLTILAVLAGCAVGGAMLYGYLALSQHGDVCEHLSTAARWAAYALWLLAPVPGICLGIRLRLDAGSLIGVAMLALLVSAVALFMGDQFWVNLHFCET